MPLQNRSNQSLSILLGLLLCPRARDPATLHLSGSAPRDPPPGLLPNGRFGVAERFCRESEPTVQVPRSGRGQRTAPRQPGPCSPPSDQSGGSDSTLPDAGASQLG